jgi:hypothetical protein
MKATIKQWKRLEQLHLVLFEVVPDTNIDLALTEESDIARTNREGSWGIITYYKLGVYQPWVRADAVWGFIGDDWKNSGYDKDVKTAAVVSFREAVQNRCRYCRGTGHK